MDRSLDAQADAFAQLLGLSPDDVDDALRSAAGSPTDSSRIRWKASRSCWDAAAPSSPTTWASARRGRRSSSLRHDCTRRPVPRRVPRVGEAQLGARDRGGRADGIDSGARRRRPRVPERFPEWMIVNYDILASHMDALARCDVGGHRVRRSALPEEPHECSQPLARRQLRRSPSGRRRATTAPDATGAGGVSADRHAAHEPAARPVRAAATSRACARPQLSLVREALLRRGEERVRVEDGRGVEPRGADGAAARRDAAPLEGQVLALPPKLRTWLPVEVPEGTGAAEIRAVVEPPASASATRPGSRVAGGGAQGRDCIQLLALLTKARRRLAVAKVDATIDFVIGSRRAGREGDRLLVLRRAAADLAKAFGEAGRAAHGKDASRRSARRWSIVFSRTTGRARVPGEHHRRRRRA